MKEGNSCSFRGRHISLALIAFVIFTTLLWTWERNPIIAMTLRSAQEWYRLPSEFPVEAPIESVGTSTLEKGVKKSICPITENGTKLQVDTQGVEAVDSTPTESPETQYNQNVMPSSRSKGTPTLEKGVEKSTTLITGNGTKLQFDTKDVAAVDSIPADLQKLNTIKMSCLLQEVKFVIMPRVSGLQTAGDRCILDSAVRSGCPQCGHVE